MSHVLLSPSHESYSHVWPVPYPPSYIVPCVLPPPPSIQVCELLDAMELGQYKEAFVRECVSGEILLECDNSILESDLGVASRLHRLRLMKVIDGIHSAASLIEGADPYVTLGTS